MSNVTSPALTWTVQDGRAVWAGRRLLDWLDDVVADLIAEFDPLEVWLFGSLARGDDNGDSDIDLLVVLDRYDPDDAISLKRRAGRCVTAPVPFDVAFSDPLRFNHRRRIAGSLERAAVTEGRLVHRRD
jgi:predicted nucleotidyltransferase